MTRHLMAVLVVLALVLGRADASPKAAATVATDREDYSPGSKASISGAGFRPGEKVRLQILRLDVADNDGPEHQPWQVEADAEGAIKATWSVTVHEAGGTLRVTATGTKSGRKAQKVFTDSSITPASGGAAIPASTSGGTWTALTGPVIVETAVGDINTGTLILTAPAGFVFDTNAPLPFITLSGDNNNKNINDLPDGATIALTVTTNTLGFTINTKSKGQTRNTLSYSNIRVRPTAATPLASGNITNTGTSSFPNSTTNFGTLTEVAGPAGQLAVSGFPSPRTAGVAGSVTVTVQDHFGNVVTGFSGTVHFTSSDPLAVLPADYTFANGDNGTHTFANGVTLKAFGTQSITASNLAPASFSGMQSGISIVPAPADHLAFVTQPGSATYGSPLSAQPVVVSQDAFGNNSTAGFGGSKIVTLTLSGGSGTLTGTASLDIGTGAGNGTATFANLAVNAAGASKRLTASASGMSNALSSTFAINPATLTAIVAVSNKIYDANTSASIANRGLSGVLGSDNVTLTGGTATFATKNAGNSKTVNVTGLGLTGTSAGNYALASSTVDTTANITSLSLTVSGVTANNKSYDGTTTATLSVGSLPGVINGDVVTLGGTPAGTFATKTVGNNKPVTASGFALSGADAGNYTLAQPTGLTANITAAGLTVSGISANNKTYDGNISATLNTGGAALVGMVSGDSVTLNTASGAGSFVTKTVGSSKPVTVSGLTISGSDSGNYSLTQPAATADITPKSLAISGITANDKTYDGNVTATLNAGSAALVGVVSGDSVTLNTGSASGTFADAYAGTGKSVTVSGLTINGTDSGNYTLVQTTTTASIDKAVLTVSADARSRTYGAANPPFTASYAGFVSGEFANVLSGAPQLTATADTNSPVGSYAIQIAAGSLSSLNYTFNFANGSLTVTPCALSVTADSNSRVYGGANPVFAGTLSGIQNGDNISAGYSTSATAGSSVGSYSIVPGLNDPDGKLSNYSVTTNNGTLTVTPASLMVTATNKSRTYGIANPALTGTLTGVVNSDDITASYLTSANTGSSVGGYSIVPSLNDPDGKLGNYSVTINSGTLSVTPASLIVAANDANRAYGQSNPNFSASIWGYVNGENASELGGVLVLTTPAQSNSLPGNYPIVPGGLTSANYSIVYSNGTLSVTTSNQAPALDPIADAVIRPEEGFVVKLHGFDPNGDSLSFSLDPGAPAGAAVSTIVRTNPVPATNTVFHWVPTRDQASTTNVITVRVADNGGPPMSVTQTFTIIVLDYLEIKVGSTNVESGQSVTVPISLASSDGVTNLNFNLQWPAGYLGNATIAATAPEITLASLQDQGTNLALSFVTSPGQVLQATQQIAQLTFTAISNAYSAFVPLPIDSASAGKPDGSAYANYITPAAIIAVIEGEPLLKASLTTNSARGLTLYGRLGTSYELQYSTNLSLPNGWGLWMSYVQTNGVMTVGVDSLNPTIFYRIFKP